MRILMGVMTGILCLAVPAAAEISGTVTFTSEYVLRGISQTNEEPAVQGSIDYASDTGFYLGIWGSNVDLEAIFLPEEAQVEIDLYGGWAWEGDAGFGLDLGLIHYDYPGADDINYEEFYVGLSYKWVSVTTYYADDFLGLGGAGTYVDANLEFGLPQGFTLGFHAGFNSYDNEVGILDYTDYKGFISKAFGKVSVEVAFTDTDENQLGDHDDGRVVVSLTVSQ